jgi:hypothetical protein
MSFGVAVVALLITNRAVCQTSEAPAADANFWESRANTRAALLAAADADSLEAAALLTPKTLSAERLQLVLRAAAAAPARPDLAWLALASCIQVESCDVSPLEARLRAADPGNGAAWMGTLERAAASTPQLSASVAGVSGSERFDIYWNQLIVHTAAALERTKTMEDREAVALATGLGAAQAIPALQRLSHACTEVTVARPEELGSCRKLAGVLRHGDSFIIEGLGLGIARRVWPASSDEYREAAAATRVLHYRLRELAAWNPDITSDAGANHYLELLAVHRTEQEALLAELLARGISPSPPAGWTEPAS